MRNYIHLYAYLELNLDKTYHMFVRAKGVWNRCNKKNENVNEQYIFHECHSFSGS
jgi:hypothetical protein